MRFVCRNFGLSDLPRRGLTPQEAPAAVLLLDVEADLSMWEHGRQVWAQEDFPVAELADRLALWLRSPAAGHEDFELDSMQAEKGLIRIENSGRGWRVGSNLTPDLWSAPVGWDVLVSEIGNFHHAVREGVTAMGIDPGFISGL
ncbi:hypothetical protein [Streptomyces sp. NPDC001068]|uniref:DUF7878 domain-containing protein n=1 Tax=Streptomyces sp. NPDC001068 TaxID=3364544 RepID=UPI0036C8810F